MTSTSDREGFCERCGCSNINHIFGQCRGMDKKGSKWVQCDIEWVRCTTGGHSDATDAKYIDCSRCRKHPAGSPEDFWGAQPDSRPRVPTADEIGIPYPNQYDESNMEPDEAGPSTAGHTRTLSTETASTDPLQWSQQRFEEETSGVPELTEYFEDTHMNTISSEESQHVETYFSTNQRRICFRLADGREVRTHEDEWQSVYVDYQGEWVPCFSYTSQLGQFYAWEHGAGESGAGGGGGGGGGGGKGKDTSKRKGKKGKGRK